MLDEAQKRLVQFQFDLKARGHQVAIMTDAASIAYLAGFWGYLSIEFGRPTMLLVYADADPVVLTPLMESEMVGAMTWVQGVETWEDLGPNRWEAVLARILGAKPSRIGIEKNLIPAIVQNMLTETYPGTALDDISPILGQRRMIKSDAEIEVMRQTGKIAGAMMQAAVYPLMES